PGTVRSALLTGVLGIPSDPRLVEVVGWVAYLVPMALFVYWPASRRLTGRRAALGQATVATVLVAAAIVAALVVPGAPLPGSGPAPLTGTDQGQSVGSAALVATPAGLALQVSVSGSPTSRIALTDAAQRPDHHLGVDAAVWAVAD